MLPWFLIPFALGGGQLVFKKALVLGLDFTLIADPLSVFMSLVSSFIGFLIIVLYSFGYISHYENQNEYYLMVVLFLGSMMGLVFSANLIFTVSLLGDHRHRLLAPDRVLPGKEYVIKADKAFLVTFFGAVVMLIGVRPDLSADRNFRPDRDARHC